MKIKIIILILVYCLCSMFFVSCYGEPVITAGNITETQTVTTTVSGKAVTTTTTVIKPILVIADSKNKYMIEEGKFGFANADNKVIGYANGITIKDYSCYVVNTTRDIRVVYIEIEPYANEQYEYIPKEALQYITLDISGQDTSISSNLIAIDSNDAIKITPTIEIPKEIKLPSKWAFIIKAFEPSRVISTQGLVSSSYELKENVMYFNWKMAELPQDIPGVGGHPNKDLIPEKVMIRGKIGGYPENIDDGYQIYYGNGREISSIQDNKYTLYTFYKIWIQKFNGDWYDASGMSVIPASSSRWLVEMR